MEHRPVTVTVVVPTKNAERTLAACLASVRAQTYPQVELVVVDNSPTGTTIAIAKKYTDHAVTWGPERSAQRNHGWRIGSGAYVAFIDADMVLNPHIVAEAVEAFARDAGLGALVIPELAFGVGFLARCRELQSEADVLLRAQRLTRGSVADGFLEAMDALLAGARGSDPS